MELEQSHIELIRTAFQEMQSKGDMLILMNYAKPLLYGENTIPFDLKQIWYDLYIDTHGRDRN